MSSEPSAFTASKSERSYPSTSEEFHDEQRQLSSLPQADYLRRLALRVRVDQSAMQQQHQTSTSGCWLPPLGVNSLPLLPRNALMSPVAGSALVPPSSVFSCGGALAARLEPAFGTTASRIISSSALGQQQELSNELSRDTAIGPESSLYPLYAIAAVASIMPPQPQPHQLYERQPNWFI